MSTPLRYYWIIERYYRRGWRPEAVASTEQQAREILGDEGWGVPDGQYRIVLAVEVREGKRR